MSTIFSRTVFETPFQRLSKFLKINSDLILDLYVKYKVRIA